MWTDKPYVTALSIMPAYPLRASINRVSSTRTAMSDSAFPRVDTVTESGLNSQTLAQVTACLVLPVFFSIQY